MGLKGDIQNALVKSLGQDAVGQGNIPELAQDLTDAILNFLKRQTFRIEKMKAIVEMEKITTVAPFQADVLPTVTYITPAGAPAPVMGGTKGVMIPKVNLKKGGGGQGGVMISEGHAYVGSNPVKAGEDNIEESRVKLREEDIVSEG